MDLAQAIHFIYLNLNTIWNSYSANLEELKKKKESKATIKGLHKLFGAQNSEDV